MLNGPGLPSSSAWTCWTDERTIIDPDAPKGTRILLGSVSGRNGSKGGDIDILWYDIETGRRGYHRLHRRLDRDDHNCPALFLRPDGRYLAVYSEHNSPFTRWRISTRPHDPTDWGPEKLFYHSARSTYANVYRVSGQNGRDGRTYCFTRADNWDPHFLLSTDAGTSWHQKERLFHYGDKTQRPYVKYASDGQIIHFIASEAHPRDEHTSIYHGYLQDGRVANSSGTYVSDRLTDPGSEAPCLLDLTLIFKSGTQIGGIQMDRAWVVDIDISDGQPIVLFQVRVKDNWHNHRFLYARYDGRGWSTHDVASAGPGLYRNEHDYTGMGCLVPEDPSNIFISTPVDPRTGDPCHSHNIFRGATRDVEEAGPGTLSKRGDS